MTVPSGKEIDAKPLEQRIKELLSSAPVVLLMKGSPDEPRCGFSRKVVDALRKDSISFNHFDILQVTVSCFSSVPLTCSRTKIDPNSIQNCIRN